MLFNDPHSKVWVQDKVVDKVEGGGGLSLTMKAQKIWTSITAMSLHVSAQHRNWHGTNFQHIDSDIGNSRLNLKREI